MCCRNFKIIFTDSRLKPKKDQKRMRQIFENIGKICDLAGH